MGKRERIAGIVWIIVGCYLIFLALKLIHDGLITGELTGLARIICILGSGGLIFLGSSFSISAWRMLRKKTDRTEENNTEETTQEDTVYPVVRTSAERSLFEHAGYTHCEQEKDNE